MGDDTVVASATITTTVVTPDPIHVQWAYGDRNAVHRADDAARHHAGGRRVAVDGARAGRRFRPRGKLEAAQAAAHRFIDNLTYPRDQIGVVTFRAHVDVDSRRSEPTRRTRRRSSTRGIATAIFCATNFCAGDGSDVTGALDIALDELESPRHRPDATKVLVYIGDGGQRALRRPDPQHRAPARFGRARPCRLRIGSGHRRRAHPPDRQQPQTTTSTRRRAPGIDFAFNNLNQDVCRNLPPFVSAGGDQGAYNVRIPSMLALQGEVHDDGARRRPAPDQRVDDGQRAGDGGVRRRDARPSPTRCSPSRGRTCCSSRRRTAI